MTTAIVPFLFKSVRLQETCWIDGSPYFTRRAIGEWLGYFRPQKAIDNIVARNPHLVDSRWAVTLNLRGTDGKEYETQIFNPIGLQLIVFKSNQPKALEFQVAVANLVYAYMTGTLRNYEPPATLANIPFLRKGSRARGRMMRAVAAESGMTMGQIRYRVERMDRGLPPVVGRGYHYITRRYRAVHPQALQLRRAGRTLREISAALQVPVSTVGVWGQIANVECRRPALAPVAA